MSTEYVLSPDKAGVLHHPDTGEPFILKDDHPDAGEPFILKDRIRVYQAAMVYRDRLPTTVLNFLPLNIHDREQMMDLEHWIGRHDPPAERFLRDLDDLEAQHTEESSHERDRRVSWEVATDLVAGISNGTITPLDTVRDLQGEPIPLACAIRLADLLSLARKRGDAGEIISSLLDSLRPAPASEIHKAIPAAYDTAKAGGAPSIDDPLAEWIFAQHARRMSFKALYAEARCGKLGEFRKAKFMAAYRKVYESKNRRPPATGWPLRSPYKKRPTKTSR